MLKIADKNRNDEQQPTTCLPVNHSLEAEILGMPLACAYYNIGDPKQPLMHILELPREAFTLDDHKTIYDGYVLLAAKDLSPTEEHLRIALTENGKWQTDESNGGIGTGFSVELREHGGVTTELPALCNELRDIYWKRSCITSAWQLHASASTNNGPWSDVMEQFTETSAAFANRPNTKIKSTDIAALIIKDLEILEQQASGIYEDTLIKTGFTSVDNATGGFGPGNLVVLAARPGMGKTSMALDLALKVVKEQIPTAIFSFEMTSQEILRRIMSKMTKINVLKLRRGDLSEWQLDQYRKASAEQLKQYPIDICDSNLVPEQIDYHIQALNRKLKPEQVRLVVVDYLQIMGATDKTKYERRDRQIATYSSQLKEIAKRHECCVVLLSQLNRCVEHRPIDERLPRMSDLRESGAIEQDADIIIGIYLPIKDNQKADPRLAKIKIMKNRSGPTGIMNLNWTEEFASFSEQSNRNDYSDVPF